MNRTELMLLDWMRKIHQLEYAHCFQSLYFSKIERRIGVWAFVLSTVVAFTYRFPFVSLPWIKEYVLPTLLFIVAILTGYQSFIKPGEKAETHRKLGLEYERLRHKIETILTSQINSPSISQLVDETKANWDSINTLYVNERHYTKAKIKVKSFKKYPEELGFLTV